MKKPGVSRLSKKQRYLQVAFNSTLEDARAIIAQLPPSDRILIEAGTPLIKRYGTDAIRVLRGAYDERLMLGGIKKPQQFANTPLGSFGIFGLLAEAVMRSSQARTKEDALSEILPHAYIVADMKTMDRGRTEVEMVALAGASAAVALGSAPTETLDAFIAACDEFGIDAMIDMMNVEFPITVLRALKKPPRVVILHRGVDEERDNRSKALPLHEIRRVKGAYDMLISIAGGDTAREVQSAVFNDADIVVIWKSVYQNNNETTRLVEDFLKEIK